MSKGDDLENRPEHFSSFGVYRDVDRLSRPLTGLEKFYKAAAGGAAYESLQRHADEVGWLSSWAMGSNAAEEYRLKAEEHDQNFFHSAARSAVDEALERAKDTHGLLNGMGDARSRLQDVDRAAGKSAISDLLQEDRNPFEAVLDKYPSPEDHEISLEQTFSPHADILARERAIEARQQRIEDVSREHLELSAKQYADYKEDRVRHKEDSKHQRRYNRVGVAVLILAALSAFFEPDEVRSVFFNLYFVAQDWLVVLIDHVGPE